MAFAAACARRSLEALIQQLADQEQQRAFDNLQTALSVVESYVTTREHPQDPFRANGLVTNILVKLRAEEELAGHVCSVISEALLAQSAAMAGRDEAITQAVSQAAHIAADTILGREVVIELLGRCLEIARARDWADDSLVDPDILDDAG
ncbi:MAG: hypothetical protein RL885_01565 [Planctomycetota bacterium]